MVAWSPLASVEVARRVEPQFLDRQNFTQRPTSAVLRHVLSTYPSLRPLNLRACRGVVSSLTLSDDNLLQNFVEVFSLLHLPN